jgi:two-component system phosphate regulon sensor histidine kinase PhoR
MLVLGAIIGHVLAVLCIGLLVYTLWNLYNLNRLTQWLGQPSKNIPETFALWDEVYYQLYHLYQRQRKARRKLTSILARFQKSTQALPYATIVLNDHDEIEWYNAAASHMFITQYHFLW